MTDFNLEGCSKKRISGKRSLFPFRVPTSISAPVAFSPAFWPLQDAWFPLNVCTDALEPVALPLSPLPCRGARAFRSSRLSVARDNRGRPFLSRGLSPDRGLSGLTAADVEAFVQTKSQENNRQSLQHIVAQPRAFLRYCGGPWREAPGGLDVIDTPRVYRGELPPRALDWTTVRRLLASIWRRSPPAIGATTPFCTSWPITACARPRLQPFGWMRWIGRQERAEGRSAEDTIDSYPTIGRPDLVPAAPLACRLAEQIVTCHNSSCASAARSRAINHYGIIDIFNYRAARSGLPLDSASSYSLRHAFAMRLLRRGVGIKVIGDLLEHRSLEATCVYLRVDIDMLRTVGLPVPGIASVAGGDHA